jgi:hypothetical protein
MFADAGMNLQEWGSNSGELMALIPEKDRAKGKEMSVLGLKWSSSVGDTLRVVGSKWEERSDAKTKREVMKAVASIFDPMGFFQPAVLPAKCFLQRLWEKGQSWDDQLDADLLTSWKKIHADVSLIFAHKIPRFLGCSSLEDAQIVIFTDASSKAYCAVGYLRFRVHNSWEARLVFAKGRLAPKAKSVTIPRLELMGVTIGAVMAKFIRSAIKVDLPVHLFTDSVTVLHWLKSVRPLKRFVANRIKGIKDLADVEFHYVGTSENPADKGTRGLTACELVVDDLWWNGPSWLAEERWPEGNIPSVTEEDIRNIESELCPPVMLHGLLIPPVQQKSLSGVSSIICIEEFSSIYRLFRVTAVVVKFLKRYLWETLNPATQGRFHNVGVMLSRFSSCPRIEATDIQSSKSLWIKSVQRTEMPDVEEAILGKQKHCLVQQLGLFIDDDGIIRSESRYRLADLPYDTKYPKLLPKNCRFSRLWIIGIHLCWKHSGEQHTLAEVRKEVWIPQGRQLVRGILSKCVGCKKRKGGAFELPEMPPWPAERMNASTPFQYIGLDYLGPINVRVVGETKKMWVCLFTCMLVRAVHLEWLMDCSAIEFLHCLIRFISRRGVPELVVCDNGSQFRSVGTVSERVWSQIFLDDEVVSFSAQRGITWKFITPLAPWQGGFYERLLGIVKKVTRVAIGRRLLWWQPAGVHYSGG